MAMVLATALAAWVVATASMTALFLDWTGSLFVAVPAALCVATGAGLLLAPRR